MSLSAQRSRELPRSRRTPVRAPHPPQAFINIGMGMTSTYLALSLMSKMSEADDAKRQLQAATAQHGAVVARLASAAHLSALAETIGALGARRGGCARSPTFWLSV